VNNFESPESLAYFKREIIFRVGLSKKQLTQKQWLTHLEV
jgi:hypothetical protein